MNAEAWYQYYAYYAEPMIEQKVVERYFNGRQRPTHTEASFSGYRRDAGNFTIPYPMGPQLTDSSRNNTQPAVRHKKSPDYLRAVGDTALMAGVTAASIFLTPETGGLSDAAGATADAALTAELEDALATETEGEFSATESGNVETELENEASSVQNKLPSGEAQIQHIFDDRAGHLSDTPENRELLENTAGSPDNFSGGPDSYGNNWYSKINSDGSQTWVTTRNGVIQNGGVNGGYDRP
ncbi:MAG: hypothetical protein LBI13_02665 [Streptococcaceae bacterium]|jgi:hypothetical protein|nr:hypothetical protein [Streptococcaceae bacterium]